MEPIPSSPRSTEPPPPSPKPPSPKFAASIEDAEASPSKKELRSSEEEGGSGAPKKIPSPKKELQPSTEECGGDAALAVTPTLIKRTPTPKKEHQPTKRVVAEAAGDGAPVVGPTSKRSLPADQHVEPTLRVLLSDPLTGELMEDAVLLPCGHSFGSGGVRRVLQSSACITCGAHVSRESLTPNLALQAVVKAFRREQRNRKALSRKRQRERLIQDHGVITDHVKPRGRPRVREVVEVPFPFKIGDQVMIKGNKRTPDRFVNREATITAQCLNGWFMVKTSDTGEIVKLQHRSLIKIES